MNKVKKIISVILLVGLVCALAPSVYAEDVAYYSQDSIKGDFDNDGEITTDDARLLLKIAAGQEDATQGADLNEDGIVSIDDVKLLLSDTFIKMTDEEYVNYLLSLGFTKSYTDSLLRSEEHTSELQSR